MATEKIDRRHALAAAAVAIAELSFVGCERTNREKVEVKRDEEVEKHVEKREVVDTVSEKPVSFVWKKIALGADGPGPRSRHELVYDRQSKATVLFGGVIWDKERLLADTWELRNSRWSRVDPGESPPARHRSAMVYDERRGFAVLFGGQGKTEKGWPFFGDTWIYERGRWRRVASGSGRQPISRCGHCLAFDEVAGVTVLFGGVEPNQQSLADTWLFDGSSWQEVSGPAPPRRRYAAFAYDPDLQGCILHGGSDDESGTVGYGDTWLFRDRAWSRLAAGFETDKRDDHAMAYHRTAKRLLMLEGVAGARGILARGTNAWRPVEATPLHPRHQCSPLAWDATLDGLVLHGGEVGHHGAQFDSTMVLKIA